MTINNTNMGVSKECKQLDPSKKIKIKVDTNGNVLYVNNYFTELTNLKISDVILKDLSTLFDYDMPKLTSKFVLEKLEKNNSYFIFKGRTNDSACYWGFSRTTIEYNSFNEVKGYLLEVKMLPFNAIAKIEKLYDILREIENNAGVSAAEKYFYGYIEDKGLTVDNFVFSIAEVNEKQAEKYFALDINETVKKKKRSWF